MELIKNNLYLYMLGGFYGKENLFPTFHENKTLSFKTRNNIFRLIASNCPFILNIVLSQYLVYHHSLSVLAKVNPGSNRINRFQITKA